MGPTSVIVALKPLPPDSEVSIWVSSDTVPRCSTFGQSVGDTEGGEGVPIPVNMMGGGDGDERSLEIETGVDRYIAFTGGRRKSATAKGTEGVRERVSTGDSRLIGLMRGVSVRIR